MTGAVNSNFTDSTDALDDLAQGNDIVAHGADGKKDEALEQQVLEQVGAVYTSEPDKMTELRVLAQAREQRAISRGDGNYRYVTFGDKKGRVIIDEFTPTTERAIALQAIWTQDNADTGKKAVEFSGSSATATISPIAASTVPGAPAASVAAPTGTTTGSEEATQPDAQIQANRDILSKGIKEEFPNPDHTANSSHRGHTDGDEEIPYVEEKDGRLAFSDKVPADKKGEAADAAAYKAAKKAGLTDDAARVYLEDIRRDTGGDSAKMLDRINTDLQRYTESRPTGTSRSADESRNPFSHYSDPKTYAHHRAGGADKDELESFDSDYSEEGIAGLSDQEEWAQVMGAPGVNGGDYLDQLYGGAGGGKFTRRDVGEIGGDGVYTSDRAKEVGELATQYRKEEFDRIDEEIGKQQAVLDDPHAPPKAQKAAEDAKKRLETEKAGIDRKIQDAIRNPQAFQRLVGKDKFQASKHEKAAAAKAREESGEKSALTKVEEGADRVKKDVGILTGFVADGLEFAGKIDTWTKRNDQFRGTQDGLYRADREAALTRQDEQRERRGETFSTQNEGLAERRNEHHTRAMEASAETGVGAGSRAGTDPEANAVADNMMASVSDVEQPGPDGKKKKKRTSDLEDLRSQVQAQRAIDRYTV